MITGMFTPRYPNANPTIYLGVHVLQYLISTMYSLKKIAIFKQVRLVMNALSLRLNYFIKHSSY